MRFSYTRTRDILIKATAECNKEVSNLLQVLIGLPRSCHWWLFKCKWLLKQLRGITHFDSGLAAKRAIQDGQEPRRVALTWFKSQMNLLPSARKKVLQLFGMTPFHSAVMLVLLIFTIVMVYVYGFKMRRLPRCSKSLSLQTPQAHLRQRQKFPLLSNLILLPSSSQHQRKVASQHCHPLPHRARARLVAIW